MRILSILVFLIISHIAYSINPDFRYLRPYEGLMDSEINSIAQDEDGLMLFATWSGLISYDGFSFNYFRPELGNILSLPEKKVKDIFIDSKNNTWIITNRNLCLFEKNSDAFYTYNFERDAGLSFLDIRYLFEYRDNLFVHAVDGFYRISLNNVHNADYFAEKISISGSQAGQDYHFEYSASFRDEIFLVTNDFVNNTNIIYKGVLIDSNNECKLEIVEMASSKGHINWMEYIPSDNSLYIATTLGLKIFSLDRDRFSRISYFDGINILSFLYSSNNQIYCYSSEPELMFIDLHTGQTGVYESNPNRWGSLLNSELLSLYEDFSGNLWIGHQGQGISILNLHGKEFNTFRYNSSTPNSITSNTVMCISGTDDEIFVGCRTGGISVSCKNNMLDCSNKFSRVKVIEGGSLVYFGEGIWDIQPKSDSEFWVGTLVGLYIMKKVSGKWIMELFSDDPVFSISSRKIFIDDHNNLWCGIVGEGLIFIPDIENNINKNYYQYKFDINNQESLSENEVISFLLDRSGSFWIGTTNGLNLLKTNYESLDLSGKTKPVLKFERFIAKVPDKNYLSNNEINSIFENYDGKIWIATQGGGINIYNPENKLFTHLSLEHGLPSNDVLSIVSDEVGNLWMSTKNGLVSYNQHLEDPSFTHFNYSDGTQGNIFMVNSYYKSYDGELFFGGDNGFTRFYPDEIKLNDIRPKLLFTQFKLFNKNIGIKDTIDRKIILAESLNNTDKISLNYNQNTFSIGVASVHYQYPQGNRIIYRLDGLSNEWIIIPSTERFIEFSNLQHGSYELQIKAISSDNIESSEIRKLKIEIEKPWYLTWYMLTFFVLITFSVIAGFVLILIHRQKLIFERKIDSIALDNNENKMRFLTNIAHGLRTPLSLVIAPINDIVQNYKGLDEEWKKHLVLAQRNSNYLHKLINQIIDFRKLNAGKLKLFTRNVDIGRLVKEVALNFSGFESQKSINLDLDIPDEPIIIGVDVQKIEEVLYNLLSNAFKHTEKNHLVKVSLNIIKKEDTDGKLKEYLRLSVFNEGKELRKGEKHRIFERFYKGDELMDGAGIGLSFSKSLVEMHNGNIDVKSIPGKGVRFDVYLPSDCLNKELTESDLLEAEYPESFKDFVSYDAGIDVIEEGEDRELKIVIVEDNEELRNFLKKVLSRNYKCYEAENGIEGLKLVNELIPDIVISDVIMPLMDGNELLKKIKENKYTCHIPVILLTAKNSQDQIISGYDTGADSYITKPFDMNIILSQISRLIKNRELIRKKYLDQNFMIEVSMSGLSKDDEFIINIRSLLEENISDSNYNVKNLAVDLGISSTQLYRKVKALTDYSPVEFIRLIKLQKAYELLNDRKSSVKEVCYLSGFNNISYFIKCFREQYGVTPANLRDHGIVKSVN